MSEQLALHQVVDPQHGNMVASEFEHPMGWTARSNMVWNFQNMSLPAVAYAQTFNPSGFEAVEFFPVEMFFWLEPHYNFYDEGQVVQGQAFLPPMEAAEAMQHWVIPKYRGNRPGLRVVGTAHVPKLAERSGLSLNGGTTEDICVKVEYPHSGKLVEEELYGAKVVQNVPYYGPQGMTLQINWGFVRLFSFKAEKGALDAQRELFWTIAGSLRTNPDWDQLYVSVLQQLKIQFDRHIDTSHSQIQTATLEIEIVDAPGPGA